MGRSAKYKSMQILMYLQIIVPGIAAVISFLYMEPHFWNEAHSTFLLPLSIFAAAALFRLARGVPTLPMDELDTEQVKELVEAYRIVTRRLAWMIGIAFVSIIGLIFVHLAYITIDLLSEFNRLLVQFAVAFVVFFVFLSFFRGFVLVCGDLDYVKIQSELIVKNVQRRHARTISSNLSEAEEKQPHKPSPNYGRKI